MASQYKHVTMMGVVALGCIAGAVAVTSYLSDRKWDQCGEAIAVAAPQSTGGEPVPVAVPTAVPVAAEEAAVQVTEDGAEQEGEGKVTPVVIAPADPVKPKAKTDSDEEDAPGETYRIRKSAKAADTVTPVVIPSP
jgi:hypothetical protein